jgi:hypothetical protein
MLGFGHQTIFGLCLALITLAAVSIVCLALLFAERRDIDLLQDHINSLRQEIPQQPPGATGNCCTTDGLKP